MTNQPQKGVIVFSMPRSGSTWLSSLTNATGQMGVCKEWMNYHAKECQTATTFNALEQAVGTSGTTANGRFAMKVFPQHIVDTRFRFKADLIAKLRANRDIKCLLLTRRDRVGQAISTLRAKQSGSWRSNMRADVSEHVNPIRYNFRKLSRAYFIIGKGYEFSRNYLALQGIPFEEFVYEDLLDSPTPYLKTIADHMEVPTPTSLETEVKQQRDAETETWRARFQEDVAKKGVHEAVYYADSPESGFLNAARVLFGNPIKPVRGGYFC